MLTKCQVKTIHTANNNRDNTYHMKAMRDSKIAVVGLGYVGLPLAVAFAKKFPVIGYDIGQTRIDELNHGNDRTREISKTELEAVASNLTFTTNEREMVNANIYILALPTPVNKFNVPDFDPLIAASETVGKYIAAGDVIIFESTVYPGATREICAPAIEKASGLVFNKDFFLGYSPERVSPADHNNVTQIIKVTSGSTPEVGQYVDALYKEIITAGTYPVSTMEVAEACKVIENAQRDVNIGFMNEVAILMNKLGINTAEVIGAMRTKWNALPFVPGMVGGHCIGVDPYYLVHKAQSVGHNMGILKATRTINDSMGYYIAQQIITLASKKNVAAPGSRALLMGATFKENCPDIRNSRPLDIKRALEEMNVIVDVYDPIVDPDDIKTHYGIEIVKDLQKGYYDIIILAVMHSEIKAMTPDAIRALGKDPSVIYDVKSVLPAGIADGAL